MSERDFDVRATASKLVRTHGKDAELVARQWACCAQRAGDPERLRAWSQVLLLVKKLCSFKDMDGKLELDCQVMRRSLKRRLAGKLSRSAVTRPAQPPRVYHPAE